MGKPFLRKGKCWCGKTHPRGDVRNGPVKHYTINLKLYQLRVKDGEEEKEKEAIPAPGPVAVG